MATIEARITKVEHDVGTGWYSILTDHDSVKKLTTKMGPKAEEAAALRRSGEVALIEYSAKQRHDEASGRTYNNHYYERARTAPQAASNGSGIDSTGIDEVSPTQRQKDPAESWRIALSVGAKLAVQTLPLMPQEQRDFETQKRIALAWAVWVFTTGFPSSEPGFAQTAAATSAPGAYDEPLYGDPGRETPPNSDDDSIPF